MALSSTAAAIPSRLSSVRLKPCEKSTSILQMNGLNCCLKEQTCRPPITHWNLCGIRPFRPGSGHFLCLMKVPFWYSSKAILNSCWVFMTMGPYQAMGSPMGLPVNSRNRTGPSAVAIAS